MKITEKEMIYLIKISNGRILNCSFGINGVYISSDCVWAIDEINNFYKTHSNLKQIEENYP